MSSRPAIIRSAVVFPQPEGPTSTRSFSSETSSERSLTASTPFENRLVRCWRTISAIRTLPLQRSGEQAANEVAPEDDVDDECRQRREQGGGHLQVVRGHERARRVVDG